MRLTPSIRRALTDVELERVWIVYPGERRIPISERVEVIPVACLASPEFSFTWKPIREKGELWTFNLLTFAQISCKNGDDERN